MASKQEYFDTEVQAIARGEEWKECWGYGYFGRFQVWKDSSTGQWVCYMTRWDSCD